MKIENIDLVIKKRDELLELDTAIKQFEKYDGSSVSFARHSDKSGFYIGHQYKGGSYHPMYTDIMKFALERFIKAREELIKEIEEL